MNHLNQVNELLNKIKSMTAQDVIKSSFEQFGSKISFASSLGEEDQVITDMIFKFAPGIEVFTLDTGRLFQETYDLIAKTQKRYKISFKIYYPQTAAVEAMVKDKGINLFYESIENRKLCCGVRKVEPLQRALKNVDAWMTGIRRDQALTRTTTEVVEWDEANQKVKINPLADWTLKQVHKYIEENKVDVNPLHKKGFVSIGCAPCTRAIKPGEDIRAGRWWWEQPEQKECGLHNNSNWKKKK